ncbi:hypothetical protein EVAR_25288_1 [Eumeta japonica]|uniref:Uncharacterized protein n=1 Tax=Eumeta variegata TaxID=151549 RepID=A0A4C1VMU4_EUMVA|nr:hypothetical protein EVAR_25288_1 [Eumeta japonica]
MSAGGAGRSAAPGRGCSASARRCLPTRRDELLPNVTRGVASNVTQTPRAPPAVRSHPGPLKGVLPSLLTM